MVPFTSTKYQPDLWARASANSSPSPASQGCPCSHELSLGIYGWKDKNYLSLFDAPGKVGEHLVDGSVRNVLVHAEARLAWTEEGSQYNLSKRSVSPSGKERLSHMPRSCPKQITCWDKYHLFIRHRCQPCPPAWCCSSASAAGWTSPCPRCGKPPSPPPSVERQSQRPVWIWLAVSSSTNRENIVLGVNCLSFKGVLNAI